ncbi:Lrp/AsnC family transcriptional regulator [Alteromonas sp. KUL49]|uniref:Lrp/AsnC family transcriptional regulator n=1 Tax=Alteromonas sp. KUL49 TaxID=2480798 RepID=UPI00102F0B97|nr:Lrp/AsnC family transcriptional regulator [Alteromonas sp. KUL49]TAP38701.1 Lrp/AsnC family transcriptional regulator [Alteromonas sp. KUL49]
MDSTDKAILRLLQSDCTLSVSEIAERVSLTTTPCWKRIQRMEQKGIIEKRVTLVNPEALGLTMTVFVLVKTGSHDFEWLNGFANQTAEFEEVVEIYRMSGVYDYMLKVIVSDMKAFDDFYKKLVSQVSLVEVTSSFAMEQIKYTTALPVK